MREKITWSEVLSSSRTFLVSLIGGVTSIYPNIQKGHIVYLFALDIDIAATDVAVHYSALQF